ncbi:MAG: DUF3536 domain-containing protein [Longimicrobiales bacterium]
MKQYICVHGHFYQPPRENPWLEAIELQDSAYPYHDWNARVTAECYAPNAASRILDRQNRIVRIVNNYARISFNFGPTLLAWLEHATTETYGAILEADRLSAERFSGHGSAIAQCFNHMIMPLANERDRRTQVHWGVRDFEQRFGRRPEGMWLPETAVDIDSLEALAEHGIGFTILEPHQARRIRLLRGGEWTDVSGGRLDPTRAYLQKLPSGRQIAIFFYDGPISRGVAFERLLSNGERFAARLRGAITEQRDWPQLVHIATDGETYGHHHRHGDMALAYALEHMDRLEDIELTNYGEYLERHPPQWQVEIAEDTAWSCAHGIERWRSDCGCHTGGQPGWRQTWRKPLRDALDWLRDAVAPCYEESARAMLSDPWAARADYIDVVLDRTPENIDRFLERQASRTLSQEERLRALGLLELQRHAMLMYTSCGWFFTELSGIETVQVIQYAGRVVQLARELLGRDLETEFLDRLAQARSNIPAQGTGREIYERAVRPAMVDLPKVGAHYAVLSLFETPQQHARVYCYELELLQHEVQAAGRARLVVGRAKVTSRITRDATEVSFGAVHLGDHNVYGGVREYLGEAEFEILRDEILRAFRRADFPAVIRSIDRRFQSATYSLNTLFRDEQRRILDIILSASVEAAAESYRRVYEDAVPLMRFIAELRLPQPRAFRMAADFVLNRDLRELLEGDFVDIERVHAELEEARISEVTLDAAGLGFALGESLTRLSRELEAEPENLPLLAKVEALVRLASTLPFEVDLLETQNAFYRLRERVLPAVRGRADAVAPAALDWVEHFRNVAERIGLAVPE